MGLGVDEDVRRGSETHQLLQNPAVAHIVGAGVQLAVGKGAGAAFSELNIGGGAQQACFPEKGHVLAALLHGSAPLEQNGLCAGMAQQQCTEKPCRSRAHYHGAA